MVYIDGPSSQPEQATDSILVLSSPKRSEPEYQGLHNWTRYYAGYSEAFVESVLRAFGLSNDAVVLDPMNGSGTTTVVTQRRRIAAVGIELNPAVAAVARAKAAVFASRPALLDQVYNVISAAAGGEPHGGNDYIYKWFSPATFTALRRLKKAIEIVSPEPIVPLKPQIPAAILEKATSRLALTMRDFLLAALVLTARGVSRATDSKNPTWLKPSAQPSEDADVLAIFGAVAKKMLSDLQSGFPKGSETQDVAVLTGDARELPLYPSSVDAIITSPPYLTRIDYAVGTTPELLVLGYDSHKSMRVLRRSIMGGPCITGGEYEIGENWGLKCAEILKLVEQHPSKASDTYYLKTYIQYFRDAEAVVREYLRVLKPGAQAVLVLQDSWYKDIHIRLDEIYVEMARHLGATAAETISDEHVRSHIGLVNTGARKYPKGDIYERVVLVRK